MAKAVNYISGKDYADMLGVSRQAIYKAIEAGRVIRDGINPYFKPNMAYAEKFLKGEKFKFPRHVTGRFLSAAAFAEILGVSKAAISKALKAGRLVAHGINPDLPKNKAFAEKARTNAGNKKEVKFAKAVGKAKARAEQEQPAEEKSGTNELSDYEEAAVRAHTAEKDEKAIYQTFKTKKLQLEIAQQMKEVIPRSFVEKFFGRITGVLHTHFLYLGERTSAHIAGICEITEPAKKLEIQQAIDKEITGGLQEVKSQALAFAQAISDLSK